MKEVQSQRKSRIDQVDPSLVQDNQVLALSVNRQDVEQDLSCPASLAESSLVSLLFMCRQRCTLFAALLSAKLPEIPVLSPGKVQEGMVTVHGN